ncbi:MAG: AAA family ATPase [Actinomycetales bacterium]
MATASELLLPALATGAGVLRGGDVAAAREAQRQRRLAVLAVVLGIPTLYLWSRILRGAPVDVVGLPGQVLGGIDWLIAAPMLFFLMLILLMGGSYVVTGRSPHTLFRPEQLDVRLDDVVGIDTVKTEVVRSLNLFLAHRSFGEVTGGRSRRGLLFEGPPGTGKTHTAKAVAAEANVPFLFATATSFQSSFYGATARKIRSYFKELRRLAEREGGAIGFIDEFDAIGGARRGLEFSGFSAPPASPSSAWSSTNAVTHCGAVAGLPAVGAPSAASTGAPHGTVAAPFGTADIAGPVVNELLVQMQSFDEPAGWRKTWGKVVDVLNAFLPAQRQLHKPVVRRPNVLLIASTNRADGLDPALLRPGRFDRRLTFDTPDRRGREALLRHFLHTRSHSAELDDDERVATLASLTAGWSPAMLEHVLDEASVTALSHGRTAVSWADVEEARLAEEVGLGQPVAYTDHELRLIATHEAGHATMAWLVAPHRRLDVLTVIKRRNALGMLAHGDREDVFTRSRSEMLALLQVAMGGQAAEELFFGDVSTGPGGDLHYATTLAAQMVGACGMTGTLVSYAAVQGSALTDSNLVGRVLGDGEGRARVEELLQEQKGIALELLGSHRHLVAALRDALVERHELLGEEITAVLEQAAAEADTVVDLRDPARSAEAAQPRVRE